MPAKGNADYPPRALQNGEQGTVEFEVTIGTDGRPKNCVVTSSSGSQTLDQFGCASFTANARYTPAKDTNGQPIEGNAHGAITFVIPDIPSVSKGSSPDCGANTYCVTITALPGAAKAAGYHAN